MLKAGTNVRLRPFPMLMEMFPVESEPAPAEDAGNGVEHAKTVPSDNAEARSRIGFDTENRTGRLHSP
jgi:hypothetical protein